MNTTAIGSAVLVLTIILTLYAYFRERFDRGSHTKKTEKE